MAADDHSSRDDPITRWRREAATLQQRLRHDPQAGSAWFWRLKLRLLGFLLEQRGHSLPPDFNDLPRNHQHAQPAPLTPTPGPPSVQSLGASQDRPSGSPRVRKELTRIAAMNKAPKQTFLERMRISFQEEVEKAAERDRVRRLLAEAGEVNRAQSQMLEALLEAGLPSMTDAQRGEAAARDLSEQRLLDLLGLVEVQPPTEPPQVTIVCRKCSYPLEHLTTSRCPECGRPFDLTRPRTYRRVRPRN